MSYGREYAAIYDALYGEKPYRAEAERVVDLLRVRAGSRILDVACGTGRHAQAFVEAGVAVTGVDVSEAMLDVARRRVPRGTFVCADMRALPRLSPPFDGATCLFDSLGYATTNAELRKTLAGVRANLQAGARFVAEVWHAAAMLRLFEASRETCVVLDDGRCLTRTSQTAVDEIRQVATVTYHWQIDGADAPRAESATAQMRARFFLAQELAALLEGAGFIVDGMYDGFRDAPPHRDTWHLVVCARTEQAA